MGKGRRGEKGGDADGPSASFPQGPAINSTKEGEEERGAGPVR